MSVTDAQRSGRPSTSADLVPAIEETCVLIAQCYLKSWKNGTISDIVHERLGYRNVCNGWVPRQLTEDHKKNRMGASLTYLLRFNDHVEDILEQIITGEETWVHQYCPETKAQTMAWKHPGSPNIKNSRYQPALGN